MIGFPRYKDILGKLADFDSEGKTEALYTYLLKYAEKPETLGQKIKFGLWSVTPWRWKSIAADRMMLIQILGLLASESQSLN